LVAHMMDLHTLYATARNGSHRAPTMRGSALPRPLAPNQKIGEEIAALMPRLTRYARVLTRDTVAADDLVQECITRALAKIDLWEQGTDLRAWLFTILHHQHVSLTRRNARQRADMELQKTRHNPALAPNQTARLELRDLQRAIAKLPQEQQSVILLVGLEGMRYDEAASIENLPVGTVRSRVARGREALRAMTGFFPGRHSQQSGKAANLQAAPSRSQEILQ
jgi:RNA polymerase sigma-70 factor (ECF subfamily)